jgi:hypothetical protein
MVAEERCESALDTYQAAAASDPLLKAKLTGAPLASAEQGQEQVERMLESSVTLRRIAACFRARNDAASVAKAYAILVQARKLDVESERVAWDVAEAAARLQELGAAEKAGVAKADLAAYATMRETPTWMDMASGSRWRYLQVSSASSAAAAQACRSLEPQAGIASWQLPRRADLRAGMREGLFDLERNPPFAQVAGASPLIWLADGEAPYDVRDDEPADEVKGPIRVLCTR